MSTMILVPLDTSPFAQQALATAGAIAKAKRGKLRLILVHETEPFDGLDDSPWNGARAAIKLLHGPLSEDQIVRERFLREAYLANSLDHAGTVHVLHQVGAVRGDLAQAWHSMAQFVDIGQCVADLAFVRGREQVQHGVR